MSQVPPYSFLEDRINKYWVRNNAEDLIYKRKKNNLSSGKKDPAHAHGKWRHIGPHQECKSVYTGSASIYILCSESQKLCPTPLAWPVAKDLLKSQYSHGQDGASRVLKALKATRLEYT